MVKVEKKPAIRFNYCKRPFTRGIVKVKNNCPQSDLLRTVKDH